MYNPVSTYRLQFNNHFTLTHLDALLPYLQTLGVTTIYASPIFGAAPESSHGYDGVDPTRINPEIGTEAQLRAIGGRLAEADMGWMQDIVPNHLAYHPDNEWLMDLLEKGPLSEFANFFDTSLASSFFHGRIMAPFLPFPMDETLAHNALMLAYEGERLVLKVQGNVLPLKPGSYATVLRAGAAQPTDAVQLLLEQIDQVRHFDEPATYAVRWAEFRLQLASLMADGMMKDYVQHCLKALNNDPNQLQQLAEVQHYRFCTEPETRQAMTYRRFFTINGLICLNMGDENVFEAYHALTKTWLAEGIIQGLRIDHIDGLFDPAAYLKRLRILAGDEAYIVVEKILQDDEDLPTDWATTTQGTSGYDFLAMVNNLLTDGRSEAAFRDFYQALIGTDTSLTDRIRYRKAYFLAQYMGGELNNLRQYFLSLNLIDATTLTELTAGELKQAIGEVLVACPVYRYYGNQLPLPADEADALQTMLDAIGETKPELKTALGLLENALLIEPLKGDADYNNRALRFYQRLMQFSGPLMAKGVEDTLLYTYNCFIGHNEVGDSPERFGMSPDAFHQAMQHRQTHWPLAQNATATHDTKRGEDVRARLNVLTALPDEWVAEVQHWQTLNADAKENDAPEPNDEYLMYQNLLGAYPMPGQDEDDFPNRFRLYLEKALQEAKRHTTGWVVEESYHEGVRAFTDRLFDRQGKFWNRFRAFHRDVADFGITNSLVQTLLKCTCPGVPDVYQGAEGWDLSLVDPDNRRPVDFVRRQCDLEAFIARQQTASETVWSDLWQHRFDGRIKLALTYALLHERRQNAALFAEGAYRPLSVEGSHREHVLAFARQHQSVWYAVVVPLHSARLCRQQNKPVLEIDWQNTRVPLPADAPASWTNCLTGTVGPATDSIQVQTLFEQLPVALLRLS